jgi:adenylate kinase
MRDLRLILIGPPGSGKGTQAKLLSKEFALCHFATGDILREAIRLGTPAGKEAEPYLASGRLVPDDLVNEVVAECFRRENPPDRFVLDGYPRTLAQATSFDQVLRQQFLDLTAAIVLAVPDQEVVRRLSGRRFCPNCQATYHLAFKPPRQDELCDECGTRLAQRADDREDTIRKRLQIYHQNTADLLGHYRAQGLLREVAGTGTPERVFADIVALLQ